MMHCQACGADIPAGASFCPGCGRGVQDATADQPAAGDPGAPPQHPVAQLQQKAQQTRDPRDVVEQELWRGGYSPKAMVGTLAAAFSLSLIVVIAAAVIGKAWFGYTALAIVVALWAAIGWTMLRRIMGIRYRLTNQRFFIERGILRRVTDRVEVIDIDDMQYAQNLIERLFDVGSLTLTSSDRDMPRFWLQGIEHVTHVADLIDQARRAERNRRGIYIEAS
jgi:membrane protein YdbS with pleckstrin-like domain